VFSERGLRRELAGLAWLALHSGSSLAQWKASQNEALQQTRSAFTPTAAALAAERRC
jgi:hypothetical protein